MPAYVNSPFTPPILAMKGVPTYLWGTFDFRVGNTNAALTNSALTSNVATVTVQIMGGPMPVIGGLISIINSTAGSGALNVARAVITGVTINSGTGAGTITFALTNSNITSVADAGTVIIEPAEVPEALVNNTGSIAALFQVPDGAGQYTIPVSVIFPTPPTGVTVTLQRALRNNAAEFTNDTSAQVVYASSAYTSGPVVEATLERGYLYRLYVSGLTGTGTIVGKLG
jgi:hypothetical protein